MNREPLFEIPPDLVRGPESDVLPLAGEVNWGMATFAVDRLRSITDGAGVSVAVIDTGIDRTHPLLQNCAAAKDFTGSSIGTGDRNQHGTHCSGTVGATDPRIGVAPGCRLLHGKALSDSGSGSGAWIAAAIRWAVEQGADVISMSLGSSSQDANIVAAMKEAAEKGVWIVAAAGNSGPNTPDVDWPGRSEHCLSVAALDSNLAPASFSSAGAKIDTSGPGVNIWSTKPGGGYRQMSGTSMATPFIAGLLALYRAALKLRGFSIPTIYELRSLLFNRSTDAHTPGDDRRTGPGWLNPLLLSVNLTADPPPLADSAPMDRRTMIEKGLAVVGALFVASAAQAIPDPPPLTPDPPPLAGPETRTETRIVTSLRAPRGHTHTCQRGHTWDHASNPTHVCRAPMGNGRVCGLSQFYQDSSPRMVAIYTTAMVEVPAHLAPPPTTVSSVQRIIRQSNSNCPNGNCPYVR